MALSTDLDYGIGYRLALWHSVIYFRIKATWILHGGGGLGLCLLWFAPGDGSVERMASGYMNE